jgi:hypothetical protein
MAHPAVLVFGAAVVLSLFLVSSAEIFLPGIVALGFGGITGDCETCSATEFSD